MRKGELERGFSGFTLGRELGRGKEMELLREVEIGLEMRESEGSTGVNSVAAMA